MQSGSQPSSPEPHPLPKITSVIGTVIALLTLMSPVVLVKHFSAPSPNAGSPQSRLMR